MIHFLLYYAQMTLMLFEGIRSYLRETDHPHAERNKSNKLPKTFIALRWIERQVEPVPVWLSLFMTDTGGYAAQLVVGPAQSDLITVNTTSTVGFNEALEATCTQLLPLLPRRN
jgi:hypothetical protein